MTPLLWMVAAGCGLPYLAMTGQTAAKLQAHGKYNNAAPREQTAALDGWGKRAAWAQANTWEALPIFVAAALTCHVAGGDGPRATALGAAWLACRVAYIAAYVGDFPTIRSLLWFGAVGATIGLFALPVL